jgi:hypothetical protein
MIVLVILYPLQVFEVIIYGSEISISHLKDKSIGYIGSCNRVLIIIQYCELPGSHLYCSNVPLTYKLICPYMVQPIFYSIRLPCLSFAPELFSNMEKR